MNISKKEKHEKMIATAKDRIYAGDSSRFVLAALMQEYIGIQLTTARKIYRKAKKDISRDIEVERVSSLSVKLAELEQLNMELVAYTDEEHTFTDALGNEQEKDISRYYDLRQKNISEQVKLIDRLADAKEKSNPDSVNKPVKYEISGTVSPLFKEISGLMNEENN